MSKDPAFLFYPGDYLRDTQTLSEKSQVSYDRIMCEHMRNICISKQQLKFFTKRLSPDEVDELMFVLTENDDGFFIEWVAESIIKRRAYSESRSQNRKGKSKKDMKNISKTYDKHMEDEIENKNTSIKKVLFKYLQLQITEQNFSSCKTQIETFFKYRMNEPKKRQYVSEKGINGLFRDMQSCSESGYDVNECLEIAEEKRWLSPDPKFYKNISMKSGRKSNAIDSFINGD